jgi:ATP-binding cassette subfamily B protein
MPPESEARPLRRLIDHTRRHRATMWLATLCSFLNKLFDLAPELLIGLAVDVVVQRDASLLASVGITDPMGQLILLAIITVLVWALESLFEYLYALLWRNLAQTVQHELRLELWSHIQGLDAGWFEKRRHGDLLSTLNDDVNQLERFLNSGANELIQVTTTVVIIGAIFFALTPSVAWMSFLPIPLILWGAFRFQHRLQPRYARVREKVGALNARLAANLGGIITIKSFSAEARETARIERDSAAYRDANRDAIRFSAAFIPLIRMVIVAGFVATLVGGGAQALDGTLEVGAFSVMVFMTQRLLWPLTRLGDTFDLYQRAMASTRRILDLLQVKPLLGDGDTSLPRAAIKGHIRLEHVDFAYDDGTPIVTDFNLDIPAGTTLAIVGPTGAGKTTLTRLLLRFFDPSGGRVTLDGHDLRALRTADLRAAIGLVHQDVHLFDGTVAENIAYGRPDAPRAAVEQAARLAEADDFIRKLPDGYDTTVGERGQKLSGGQRQRIAIARAILPDPPILVFDEATSAVDNETEAAIQRSLAHIARGRTTILIAHRLSTIRDADTIIVLADGRIVEQGRHDDLVARGGAYAGLWRVQTGAAKLADA